ncbi:mycofactocin precursor MftA [Parafrankia discariae]|uniref:mycofactocin precursor MftA n=1 Tax=Parafrankia discariae TaxID=365528 RepID=UPI00036203C9|nr:mycofactocin precursor MftA [Parafrankia discariae]
MRGNTALAGAGGSVGESAGPVDEAVARPSAQEPSVEEELLIEEVSIDGMCGVY